MDRTALREEFGRVQTEAQALISLASKENRALTAEEKEANDKRWNRLEVIRGQFEEDKRFATLTLAGAEGGGTIIKTQDAPGKDEFFADEGRVQFAATGQDGTFNMAAYKAAMGKFVRTGETRQLYVVTTGTQSGAYLPKQVLQPVNIRRLQNCWRGVLAATGYQPIEVPSPSAFSLPVADDTAVSGQTVSESVTSGTEADPDNTGAISFSPVNFGSKQVWYSNTMVLAQSFDVTSFTLPIVQKRIDKIQESTWTTNVMTNGTVGLTLAATTAMTYNELLNWEHSLLPAYRADACFVLADSRGLRHPQTFLIVARPNSPTGRIARTRSRRTRPGTSL